MLGFFPTPYPDELFYSILARYHTYSPNKSSYTSTKDLFGKRVGIGLWWQGNLSLLEKNLPLNCLIDSETIINNFSLIPIFEPFIEVERAQQIKKILINENEEKLLIKETLGVVSQGNNFLYSCPTCLKEDRNKYGEGYWHRVHQINGVLLCPSHGDVLQRFIPVTKEKRLTLRHLDFINHSNVDHIKINLNEKSQLLLFDIAKDMDFLLRKNIGPQPNHFYALRYRRLMSENGLSTANEVIKRDKLHREFNNFYGEELLSILNCQINTNNVTRNWFYFITQIRKKNRCFSAINHVLMMRFLSGSVKNFFDYHLASTIYGDGPWYCLNPSCSMYKKKCIEKVAVTESIDAKKPIGTFLCEFCGFKYSRIGLAESEIEEQKIHRIIEFGPIWENKLIQLINTKQSLRSISKEMGVHPLKIKEIAENLNLKTEWKPLNKKDRQIVIKERTEEYRKKWLIQSEENKSLSRRDLLKLSPGVTAWLKKYDKDWLEENLPERKATKKMAGGRGSRIDWESRDLELCGKIKQLIENWQDDEKPVRITKTKILQMLGIQLYGKKKKEKFPKSIHYLETVLESKEDFQARLAKKNPIQKSKKRDIKNN